MNMSPTRTREHLCIQEALICARLTLVLTQAARFDEQDFATDLRRAGMGVRHAEAIASGVGLLATEMREGFQGLRDAIHALNDRLDGFEERLGAMEVEVAAMASLLLGAPDPEAHEDILVDFGNAYLGSCGGCSWQRAARTNVAAREQHQQHYARLN